VFRVPRWLGVALLAVLACAPPQPAVVTPLPSTPRSFATPVQGTLASVGVAVAVASPTPTASTPTGDYPALVRPRLERIEQGLIRFESQLSVLRQSPVRMADADWRAQTSALLDELAAANADLRALGARVGPDAALYAEVSKLTGDLEFVVDEYRLAFDFDPDASHFARAGRAERSTADEVQSMLAGLRRPIGTPPRLTPSPTR
jgi:hypothetical protein